MRSSSPFSIEVNSPLMHAIITNQTEEALRIIEVTPVDDATAINQPSFGNSPLILALKTGNVRVVRALLAHSLCDTTYHDHFGMTALHWACWLRLQDIIEILLTKKVDVRLIPHPGFVTQSADDHSGRLADQFKHLTLVDFYARDLLASDDLLHPANIRDRGGVFIASNAENQLIIGRSLGNFDPAKNHQFHRHNEILRNALVQVPSTAIAFHLDSHCINTCASPENMFIRSCATMIVEEDDRSPLYIPLPSREVPGITERIYANDQYIWNYNFNKGYEIFRASRNARSVNEILLLRLQAMQNTNVLESSVPIAPTVPVIQPPIEEPLASQEATMQPRNLTEQLTLLYTQIESVSDQLRIKHNVAPNASRLTKGETTRKNAEGLCLPNMYLTWGAYPEPELSALVNLYNVLSAQHHDDLFNVANSECYKAESDPMAILCSQGKDEFGIANFLIENNLASAMHIEFDKLHKKIANLPNNDPRKVAAEDVCKQAAYTYEQGWTGHTHHARILKSLALTSEVIDAPLDQLSEPGNHTMQRFTKHANEVSRDGKLKLLGSSLLLLGIIAFTAAFIAATIMVITLPVVAATAGILLACSFGITGSMLGAFSCFAGLGANGFFSHANQTRVLGNEMKDLVVAAQKPVIAPAI